MHGNVPSSGYLTSCTIMRVKSLHFPSLKNCRKCPADAADCQQNESGRLRLQVFERAGAFRSRSAGNRRHRLLHIPTIFQAWEMERLDGMIVHEVK